MSMSGLTIRIPDEVLVASGQSREDFLGEASLLLAAKLFETGRLSSGQAARMCGMGRVEFLFAVGRLGVPVADLDEADMVGEFRDA